MHSVKQEHNEALTPPFQNTLPSDDQYSSEATILKTVDTVNNKL